MRTSRVRRHSSESGYAYIMAMFLMVAMIASSEIVLQNIVTLGRRQREAETIWRGEQYERAIRSYYRKTGHYPQTVDDLEKGLPDLHFLRFAAYKNPMNPSDGTWRFIYVNAAGQIIGSTRYGSLQQMALMEMNGGQLPTAQQVSGIGVPVSGLTSSPSAMSPPSSQTSSSPSTTGAAPQSSASGAQNAGDTAQTQGAGQPAGFGTSALAGQPQPTGPVDGPVIGAFLTGVGIPPSIDRPSVKVYKGAKKYSEWEFIWNPIEEQARAVQNGLSPQGVQPGQLGLPIGPAGGASEPPAAGTGGAVIPPQTPSPDQPQPQSP